ncbi:MAG: hypothetical protein WED09_03495 [Homoserinimonas sp.]
MKRTPLLVVLACVLLLTACGESEPAAEAVSDSPESEQVTESTGGPRPEQPDPVVGAPETPPPAPPAAEGPTTDHRTPSAPNPIRQPPPPGFWWGEAPPANPLVESIVLGQLQDEYGQSQNLVLNVASGGQAALLQNNVFAVVSGSTKFSVTGGAPIEGWRFGADSALTGDQAPIIIVKAGSYSVEMAAANPSAYTAPSLLTEDVAGTSARLTALIAEVVSKAEATGTDGTQYQDLAGKLQDPAWNGVVIFNASATVPAEVLGQSTEELADTQVAAHSIGFDRSSLTGTGAGDPFFALVDYTGVAGSESGTRFMRAQFVNSALTYFVMGTADSSAETAG